MLIARPTAEQQTAGATQGGIGSTLRVYDPGMDAWWVVWAGPVDREFSTLFARQDGDRIVLDGQWSIGSDGGRFRWSFSDITPDRFHWQGRHSADAARRGGLSRRCTRDGSRMLSISDQAVCGHGVAHALPHRERR